MILFNINIDVVFIHYKRKTTISNRRCDAPFAYLPQYNDIRMLSLLFKFKLFRK